MKYTVLSLLLCPLSSSAAEEWKDVKGESTTNIVESTQQKKQKRVITGVVRDSDTNEPIIGASVWLKNSSVGAVTDIDGKYSITIEGVGGVLEFSYIGMKKQEIAIIDQKSINVTLQPDTEVLDEVVVVGYGSQKKESVVGAISTLDIKKLKVPGASISNVLAGQLSGVVAMTRSGEPGKNSAADFYIRGVSSFKGTSTPLVLVDGIERDLDLVDTDDIASFSILKDASASAVYGVRGANGVILITTKKGEEGKPAINVRTEFGFTSPTKRPKMLDSARWAELYNEASSTKYYSDEVMQKYREHSDPDLYPDVDWFDALFDDMAENQRVNLSITGGGDIVKYYVSGSFYNESSIYKNAGNIYGYDSSINYNKFNFRANIDLNLTKSTVLNVNLANIYEKSFGPGFGDNDNDIWGYTFNASPNAFPIEYSDGKLSGPSTDSGFNPWNMLVHSGYREQFWNSAQALVGVTQDIGKLWKPLEGLTANLKFSWDAWNTTLQRRSKTPTFYHARGRDDQGNLIYDDNNGDGEWDPVHTGSESLGFAIGRSGTMTRYLEGSLNYNRLFAEKHRVGALLLYNQKIHTNTQAGSGDAALPYKNQGLAGRVTYAFKDTYFAEVNVGYNGSENFARGHRFGFFPAAAIGWMMSNEKWFEPITNTVDMLKLKASYGKVGNDDIGGQRRWVYESSIVGGGNWQYGQSANQGGDGIRIGEVENLNASWEEALKLNVGIEFSLFNKVKVQADYFREERTGIFLQRAGLPAIVGISTIPYVNIGETLNQGFDSNIEYSQKIGNVYVTARGNFTYNRNKLKNNDEPDWEYKYQNRIGKPFGSGGSMQPFGLVALGLFQSQEEIDNNPHHINDKPGGLRVANTNGDDVIDDNDRVPLGNPYPDFIWGMTNTLKYRDFDLAFTLQGQVGGKVYNTDNNYNEFRMWNTKYVANRWLSVEYPGDGKTPFRDNGIQHSLTDYQIEDAGFIALRDVTLGYDLPRKAARKVGLSKLRVYVSAQNLLYLWSDGYRGINPEARYASGVYRTAMARNALQRGAFPIQRTFSAGLNINF